MNLGTYDMPIIIGEFSFHATDRGMFAPGYVPVPSQAVRAGSYTDYMTSVFENPNFVGAHWFQYMDQPIVGRAWDGENGNVGFVDITDTLQELSTYNHMTLSSTINQLKTWF